jgi:hypothetical protein
MKRLLPLLALLAALAAAATLFLSAPDAPFEGPQLPEVALPEPREAGASRKAYEPAKPALPDPSPAPPRIVTEIEAGRPETAIAGAVFAPSGNPLRGALVELFRVRDGSPLSPGTRKRVAEPVVSDERGRFHFGALRGGSDYAITVEHGSYAPLELLGVDVGAGELKRLPDLTVKPGITIHGTITTDDGEPLAGATVALYARDARRLDAPDAPTKQILSDERGDYSFTGLAPGGFQVTAAAKGRRSMRSTPLLLEAAADSRRIDFRLAVGRQLRGRVVTAGDEPVAGAIVEARTGDPKVDAARAATDAGGIFVLEGLGDERVRLEARKKGFSKTSRNLVDPAEEFVVLHLEENAGITGFVIDAVSRKPVDSFGLILHAVGRNDHLNEPLGGLREFHSTADGSFTIEDVPPGRYRVQAFTNEHGPTLTAPFDVQRMFVHGMVIEMKRGATLRGTITDVEGEPLAGATVRMFDNAYTELPISRLLYGDFAELARPVTSGDDGVFAFENLAGVAVQLRVSAPGRTTAVRRDVAVREGEESDVGVIVLGEGGTLRGVVSDSRGVPSRGARITVMGAHGEVVEVSASSEGEFEVRNLLPGDYTVAASPLTASGMVNPLESAVAIQRSSKRVQVIEAQVVRVDLAVP